MEIWYIKIHRKILNWEWYHDINTFRLFTHLLLKANFEDRKWQGIIIWKWEILTWRFTLSKETWLTAQQCRTSLNKLKSTNEITIKSTNKYSIIKLLNYEWYQDNQPAKHQTNNKRITTPKEDKEYNNISKDNIIIETQFFKLISEYEKTLEISQEDIQKIKDITWEILVWEELLKFYNHWAEKTKTWKMRWQLEKTFELKRRLLKWKSWIKTINKSPDTPPSFIDSNF